MTEEAFPTVGEYRGVGLHAFQPPERIGAVVKPAIDVVHGMSDIGALASYAADARNAPEARLLAAAKCEAGFTIAVDERRQRPAIDLLRVRASVAGLTKSWMSTTHYGSDLDAETDARDRIALSREIPLSDRL